MLQLAVAFAFTGTQRFRIVRKLGEGGMGIVYEAFDSDLQTPIALKTLRTWTPALLLRFKKEFRAFQHLSHPNLVSLGGLYEERDQWFFTMELIDGTDWLNYVSQAPSRAEQRLRATIRQIVLGLKALHTEGKVHRDIKPTNVVVTAAGRTVLLDYGLATETNPDEPFESSAICGTPIYMAPEQLDGGQVGPEVDAYSLGIMLYQAMTGRVPFSGPVPAMGANKHRGSYESLERVAQDRPADFCVSYARDSSNLTQRGGQHLTRY